MKFGIRGKLVATLIVTGVVPLLIAVSITYTLGIAERRKIIGESFQQLSEDARENIELMLTANVRAFSNLAEFQPIIRYLKSVPVNNNSLTNEDPMQQITNLEQQWAELDEEDPPLKRILENPLAKILVAFNSFEYTFGEIFATDALGRLVAATNKTTDYWQADEDWWQRAYNDGEGQLYLSRVGFDESAQIYSIDICVPVIDSEKKLVGVIKGMLNVTRVFEDIIDVDVGKDGRAVLASGNGAIILSKEILSKDLKPLQRKLPREKIPDDIMGSSGWFVAHFRDRPDELVGFARIAFKTPKFTFFSPWLVILSQELSYAFAPVRTLIWYVSLSGAVLILVFFFLGLYLTEKKVVSRLGLLTRRVMLVANGDLTQRALVTSKDEIGELAASFNQMVSNLYKRTSLDNMSLNMLSHLELTDVLSMTMETLKSTFNVAFARIWLVGDGDLCEDCIHAEICQNREQCLHLNITVGIYAKDELYTRIPLGALKVGRIAESRQPSMTNNLAKDEQLHDLKWHLKERIVSFAGYPLLAGDELLGVLAMFCRRPISDEELKILGSFVNRTAMAIQNAKLLSAIRELNLNLEKKVEERTQELASANAKLKKADRLKSEFLANMSHELRTPLNAVIGFAEVLRDGICGKLNDDQMMSVIDIYESGKHLLQMINAVLDLSKVEAGKMELQPEEFSLFEAINTSLSIVRDLANKKNLYLQAVVPEDLPNVYADPVKFKQIMYNLLSNAVKFTPEEGSITINIDFNGDEFTISVTDTGIGLEPEDQEAAFEEFKQVDASRSREYEGTGLGLALTKKFVELHGGKIWVESEGASMGSKFSFTLPFHDLDLEISQNILDRLPPTAHELVSASEKTILVAEDNPQAAQLLCIYLTEAEYNPIVATNGDKAVEMARELKPFAITLDIMLPKKDGWQVMQELKSFEDTRDIPIIIISVVDNQSLGFSMGAVGYLTKPIDKEQLTNILNKIEFVAQVGNFAPQILIIDDNPDDLKLMESILQSEGFDVLKALSGEAGITKAVKEHPDLIILDLLMPGMSGFDVVKSLQEHPKARDIPIIICTIKELTAEDRETLNSKVQSIVQKGEDAKTRLLEAVRKIEQLM